jgi:hypothetical protein
VGREAGWATVGRPGRDDEVVGDNVGRPDPAGVDAEGDTQFVTSSLLIQALDAVDATADELDRRDIVGGGLADDPAVVGRLVAGVGVPGSSAAVTVAGALDRSLVPPARRTTTDAPVQPRWHDLRHGDHSG